MGAVLGSGYSFKIIMMTYYSIETPFDSFGAPIQPQHWSQGDCSHKAHALPSSVVDMASLLLSAQCTDSENVRIPQANSDNKAQP